MKFVHVDTTENWKSKFLLGWRFGKPPENIKIYESVNHLNLNTTPSFATSRDAHFVPEMLLERYTCFAIKTHKWHLESWFCKTCVVVFSRISGTNEWVALRHSCPTAQLNHRALPLLDRRHQGRACQRDFLRSKTPLWRSGICIHAQVAFKMATPRHELRFGPWISYIGLSVGLSTITVIWLHQISAVSFCE